jgi:Na+/proline symporter/signal transduction histidine kinase
VGFEIWHLYLAAVAYLGLLFLIAYATDHGWIPQRLARHPATYVLSLGVYATSWTYYGSVGFAHGQGYNYLTIYLGVTLAFMLAPVLLVPILRLVREYQLTSLADLFAFRYRSQSIGIVVTLFMLIGALPYISLQIRAITESVQVLTSEVPPVMLAVSVCVTLILFAILFGARHTSARERHGGLVVAIAFESLVKLVALLTVGSFALFGIFGGPAALDQWLSDNPQVLQSLYEPVREGPWATLLLLAFTAAFLLPRQFHMTFTENRSEGALMRASWAFPLYLLLLNLAIPVILWAGMRVGGGMSPDYYVLGITLSAGAPKWLSLFAFIGGVSAASAMIVVTTLALSSMCLNHLLLPASYPDPTVDLYRWLLWGRRVLIAMIIMAGLGFYELLEHNQGLVELGLISFVAVAQFLPGVIGVLYWRRATRLGVLLGLAGGIATWTVTLLLPLLADSQIIRTELALTEIQTIFGLSHWEFATFWSLAINTALFVVGSLIRAPSPEESEVAYACCTESFALHRGVVRASSTEQFTQSLARVIGLEAAEKEVARALSDLAMSPLETHPGELRRLRERLERNLSGLLGPQLAHMIVNQRLELDPGTRTALADTVRYAEQRIERSRSELRGLAAELDVLRRYHRQILVDLPLGVCAVSPRREVTLWNLAMEMMSGVPADTALDRNVIQLPAPWNGFLSSVIDASDQHIYHRELEVGGQPRWFSLHKAAVADPSLVSVSGEPSPPGMVILIEDLTEIETLEAELAHSERLASIGRLAAGVAHEIGNPVTGIASLAQNLRDDTDSALVGESVEQILQQTRRINNIVTTLMSFSRSGDISLQPEYFGLAGAVDEAIQLVRLSRSGKRIECMNHCPADLEIFGDRQRMLQVFVNLLSNACDASVAGDCVEVRAQQQPEHLEIEIRDNGQGIPEELVNRVFEPFFTTKKAGDGTGLGLSLVYKIIYDHGGNIEIDSSPGKGTRVSILFPQGVAQPHREAL